MEMTEPGTRLKYKSEGEAVREEPLLVHGVIELNAVMETVVVDHAANHGVPEEGVWVVGLVEEELGVVSVAEVEGRA